MFSYVYPGVTRAQVWSTEKKKNPHSVSVGSLLRSSEKKQKVAWLSPLAGAGPCDAS